MAGRNIDLVEQVCFIWRFILNIDLLFGRNVFGEDSGFTSDTEADAAEWRAVLKGCKTKQAIVTVPSALIPEDAPIAPPPLTLLPTALPAADAISANSDCHKWQEQQERR